MQVLLVRKKSYMRTSPSTVSVQSLCFMCVLIKEIGILLSPLDKLEFSNITSPSVISVLPKNGEHAFTISYNNTPRLQTFVGMAWNLGPV